MLCIIHAIAVLALSACSKSLDLWGNVSSSDDDGLNVVRHYHYVDPVCRKRDKIADIAKSHIGHIDWAYDRSKGNFPAGTPKCNLFVYDVLSETNACPLSKRDETGQIWPIRAADWTTDHYNMLGWMNMSPDASWQRGDVIAEKRNYTNASGHCGIAVSSFEVVAAGTDMVTRGDHGFRYGNATVVRYYGVGRD